MEHSASHDREESGLSSVPASTSQTTPIASVAPVTHAMSAQQQFHSKHAPQPQIHHQAIVSSAPHPNATPAIQMNAQTITEKCRFFW